jgi:mycothiol synthase
VSPIEIEGLSGRAELTPDGDGWTVQFVARPGETADDCCGPATPALMRAAIDAITANGGGRVRLWVNRPRPEHERAASELGLAAGRALYQMRRPLPYDLDDPDPGFLTRPFRPGVDEAEWLAVNNRAFSWHPEQGGWGLDDVSRREGEPWFDAEGFLIHEDGDGRIDGFCWTKVHADHDPPLGEIYVIAVDPSPASGRPARGLGRRLTAAGLGYLHSRRGLGMGMLYVDAGNTRAVKLYVDMGFVVNHIDLQLSGNVPAVGEPRSLLGGKAGDLPAEP